MAGRIRCRLCRAPGLPDESPELKFTHRLPNLRLRVHHDRTVPGDRFLDRATGYQQEADALVTRLDDDLVPAVEQNQGAVAEIAVVMPGELVLHRARRRGVTEPAGPGEDVGKRVA